MKRIAILGLILLFFASFASAQFSLKLDFDDPSNIDTAEGWVSFVPAAFTEEIGYGWEEGFDSGNVFERITTEHSSAVTYTEPQELYRDHHESRNPHNFRIKLPNGYYQVKMYFGKTSVYGWASLVITAEDKIVASFSSSPSSDVLDYRQYFDIMIEDGYLDLDFVGEHYLISGIEVNEIQNYPNISSISSEIAHNVEVTISGNNFGTKNPVAPLIWEDFELGSNNEDLIGWNLTGNHPQYSDTIVRNAQSRLSGRMNTVGESWNSGAYRRIGHKRKIYSSMNFYIQRVTGVPSWNIKMFRMTAGVPGYNNGEPSMSITLNHPTYGGNVGNYVGGSQRPNQTGMGEWSELSWQRWEYYLKISDPIETPTGTMHFWSDGEKRIYWDEILTMASGASQVDGDYAYIDSFVLPFYAANSSSTSSGDGPNEYNIYYDDIYVDNTLARVEICSEENWHGKRNCEIQIPFAWSNSSITFTAKQGNFAEGEFAYLYVVDETGTVNENGFEVNFGEAPPCIPETEICDNGTDEDCDSLIDCDDSDCDSDPVCETCVPETEICDNGLDDDCDLQIDCDDSDCDGTPECPVCVPETEICDNAIDDDCDSLVDCDDAEDCGSDVACTVQECTVDFTECTISIPGATISCTPIRLEYEYDSDILLDNIVTGLPADYPMNILVENLTQETSNEFVQNSNAEGTLEFST